MQTHRFVTVRTVFVAAAFSLTAITASGSFAADAPARPNAANTAAKKPGTAKPVLGDILQGTDIRKKPDTAKPVVGDILEGTNIRKTPGAANAPTKPGAGKRKIESPRDISSGQATGK
ncbi:MAG: hypothetical protein ABL985_02535 [Casimicrobium sp.]